MSLKHIGFATLTILVLLLIWLWFAMTGYPSALNGKYYERISVRIDNVRLISMSPSRPQVEMNQSVIIVDGVIQAVGKADDLVNAPGVDAATLTVIDGKGQTLMPGLIDAHVHLFDEAELAAYLSYGVTSIRNMSGMPFHLPLAQRIADGDILGPDLLTTGPILNSPGANVQPGHHLVVTADEARAAVQDHYERGFRSLKIYSNLTREAYVAILDEAQALRVTITGHTPEGVRRAGIPRKHPFNITFEETLDDGFQTFEHIETIVWHGLRDDLDLEKMQTLAEAIKQSGATVTPTLIAHNNLMRIAESKGAHLGRLGVETINPVIVRAAADNYAYWSDLSSDGYAYEAAHSEFFQLATGILHEAGVPLIAGTDAGGNTNIPGSSMIRELECLVAAGLSNYEALQAATVTASFALGLPDRGQIVPGFRANMVLVSGNPLVNIPVLENPTAVMLGGIWLDESALTKLAEAARQTSMPRSARRLIEALWVVR